MVTGPVRAAVLVNGVRQDSSLVYLPVEISHGRARMFSQPDAPSAEFETHGPTALCVVGDTVTLITGETPSSLGQWTEPGVDWEHVNRDWTGVEMATTTETWADGEWSDDGQTWSGVYAATQTVRFVGRVSGMTAVEVDGAVSGWRVRAISGQAELGFRNVLLDRPVETDVARVGAIAAAAGVSIAVVGDPSLTLAADAIDRDVLSAVQEVCASSGGMFWTRMDGTFTYGTASHRSGSTTETLPASAILDGIEWENDTSQIINSVTIKYPRPASPPKSSTGYWQWQTSTDMDDPGGGNLQLNADPGTDATAMALSSVTDDGTDVANFLGNYQTDTRVYLQEKADSSLWVLFRVTGAPIDQGGWFEFPIAFEDSSPAGDIKKKTPLAVLFSEVSDELQRTYTDQPSIDQWGTRHTEASTLCADEAEAGLLALTILARRSQPFWSMPGVMIPVDDVDTGELFTLESLDVSVGVLLPIPDDPAPTPSVVEQWAVEGFVEQWAEDGRWVQFAVSDWARSSSALLRDWQEVNDQFTWTTAAETTWQRLVAEVV